MSSPAPHQIMTCPYDKSHQIEQYRLHIHIQKCRKQHRHCNKSTCPFDATHIVNDVELDYHVTTCPKRVIFDSQVYVADDDQRPPVEVSQTPAVLPTEESWDDGATASYKPDLAKKGAHIITKVKGATPSERRKARMEGIKTYRPLQEE